MNQLALIFAYRQLLKNKWYTAIKIGGLALGFLFFIFIVLYYQYEHSYEKWNPSYQNIARFEFSISDTNTRMYPVTSYPIAEYVEEFTKNEVEKATLVDVLPLLEDMIIRKTKNDEAVYVKGVLQSDSNFLAIFSFPFVHGSAETALKEKNSVVLTRTLSERLFGDESPLGKKVYFNENDCLTVRGVIETANHPTHLSFEAVTNTIKEDRRFQWRHYYCYFLLKKNITTRFLESKIDMLMRNNYFYKQELKEYLTNTSITKTYLRPIKDIHLKSHSLYEADNNANELILNLLLGVSIALLIITAINFFNLTLVQLSTRSKEIITDILFSASKRNVYRRFIIETLVYVFLALFISFILIEVSMSFFEKEFGVHLSLFASESPWRIILVVSFVIILLAVIGGAGPVYHLSKIPPSVVLKGNYSRSNLGKKFMNALLVIQFSIAFMAIVSFFVIIKQFSSLFLKPLGFNMSHVVCIKVHKIANENVYQRIKARLLEHPNIEAVSFNLIAPGDRRLSTPSIKYHNQLIHSVSNYITDDYEKVLQLALKDGRPFSRTNPNDSVQEIMVSEYCANLNKLRNFVNDPASKNAPFVAMFKDYYHQPPTEGKLPIALIHTSFMLSGGKLMLRLKRKGDRSCYEHMAVAMREIEPEYPLQRSFLLDDYEENYNEISQLTQFFLYILIISSIVITIGLFAVSTFIAQQRGKEIAIRRVLGATSFQIMTEINKRFFLVIVISIIVSAPIIYTILNYWLNHYVEHVSIGALPFVLAILIIITFTLSVNALVGNKVLGIKPVENLRYE
jgi:putative ABC transport system permease protein